MTYGSSIRRPHGLTAAAVVAAFLVLAAVTTGYLQQPPQSAAAQPSDSGLLMWANDGADKVLRDETRASDGTPVTNSMWDGSTISVFGARNETVSFNLVMEATSGDLEGVDVSFDELSGPGGASITTRPAIGNEVFDYRGRNIELFYVRYLRIEGVSTLPYEHYDERHVPELCRRPFELVDMGDGITGGLVTDGSGWEDRPCHDREYPDIAVPLELESPFSVAAGNNQSIWVDIYIPSDTPAGPYTGTVTMTTAAGDSTEVPVELTVRDFALPDLPGARTMLVGGGEDVNLRYLGEAYPERDTPMMTESWAIEDRHHQMAHRHRISMADNYVPIEQMDDVWTDRLSGDLFTEEQGYDGPGEGVGNNLFSIGTYASWPWFDGDRDAMWENSDAWVEWFDSQNFETQTDYFLYLIDESDDYAQIEEWSQWLDENPGPGSHLPGMSTTDLQTAGANIPSLDLPVSADYPADTAEFQATVDGWKADPDNQFWWYNGLRPSSGTFTIEDEGVALRMLPWIQQRHGIDRWFYWQSTYYDNYQCYGSNDPKTHTNVFQHAQTFGCDTGPDPELGHTGWNYTNGDGVLFYPGTDTLYPEDSYDIDGPIASLRLKHWRRGVQDFDYLTMATAIDPGATEAIMAELIPKTLWEVGISNPEDPTYVHKDISWPTDPDVWEAARAALADIIEGTTTPDPDPDPDPEANCDGTPATIVGTDGDDRIQGTPGDDVIATGRGHDIVIGGGGKDVICTG